MGKLIENTKTYTGEELLDIFLRPSFVGENAAALGIKVMPNVAVNTTVNFWQGKGNILKPYAKGWEGGDPTQMYQKTIEMAKIKAEKEFAADDYKNTVFERITNTAGVNLQDLTGTDIEKAEIALFREAIAESIRVTMWVGDKTKAVSDYELFDGLLTKAASYEGSHKVKLDAAPTDKTIKATFDKVWKAAPKELKALKDTGKLVYFVSDDVFEAYESFLDGYTNTVAYNELQLGRAALNYHGVEVRRMAVDSYINEEGSTHIILSHKDNLVFAMNTTDMPEAGVRMWYNPDEMENRQRACFLAGTEILDENIVVYASTAIA